MFTLDPTQLAVLTSVIIPLVVGLITKKSANKQVKAITNIVVTAVAALLGNARPGHLDRLVLRRLRELRDQRQARPEQGHRLTHPRSSERGVRYHPRTPLVTPRKEGTT